MTLPRSIKIGAQRYAVSTKRGYVISDGYKRPDGSSIPLNGLTDYDQNRVLISGLLGAQAQRQTMMHEVVHALFRDMGKYYDHDEFEVDNLANRLLALVQENPKLIAYLQEKK